MMSQASIIVDLDAQIYEALLHIAALRQKRNEATITCRLPPELLANIMLAYKAVIDSDVCQAEESWKHSTPKGHPIPWIAPSHVSTHWRSVALSCAALWSTIWLRDTGWTKACLERSKNALLNVETHPRHCPLPGYVYLDEDPNLRRSVVKCLSVVVQTEALSRVHSLKLDMTIMPCHSISDHPVFSRLLLTSFPRLNRLELISTSSRNDSAARQRSILGREIEGWSTDFLIRVLTDERNARSLKQLTLYGYPSSVWTTMHCIALTHLWIANFQVEALSSILELLGRLELLEDLHMHHLIDDEWSEESRIMSRKEVAIPHLRRLTITLTPVNFTSALLECVALPRDVQLTLSCTSIRGDKKRQVLRFFKATHPYLHDSACPFRSLLFHGSGGSLTIALSQQANVQFGGDGYCSLRPGEPPEVINATHEITFPYSSFEATAEDAGPYSAVGNEDNALSLIPELLRHVLWDVERLVFVDTHSKRVEPFRWNSGAWIEVFAGLPRLEIMEVRLGLGAQDMLLATLEPRGMSGSTVMDDGSLGDQAAERRLAPFSALRNLDIRFAVFPQEDSLDDPEYCFTRFRLPRPRESTLLSGSPTSEVAGSEASYTSSSSRFLDMILPRSYSPNSESQTGPDYEARSIHSPECSQSQHGDSSPLETTFTYSNWRASPVPSPPVLSWNTSFSGTDEDTSIYCRRSPPIEIASTSRGLDEDSEKLASRSSPSQSFMPQIGPGRPLSLLSILRARHEAGLPLRQLSFTNCGGLNSAMLSSLRGEAVVENLVWDEQDVVANWMKESEVKDLLTAWRYLGKGEKEE